jgi:DNA-directed RNA polymerase-3 subunit RPC5
MADRECVIDRLHLTPISSTIQLRPQFHHVDTQLDQERAATKALREVPQKQEARAIQLSVKNAEDPSSQLSSTMKALRIAEEEAWTKLHWVDQDTDEAWEMYAAVCLKDGEAGQLECVTTKKEYIEWLSAGKPIVKQPKEIAGKKEG